MPDESPDPLKPKPPPDELNRLVAELREANERLVVAGVRLQALAEEAEGARRDAERSRKHAEAASQAKDEFVATVSHELRTPLNAILGWIQLLRHSSVPADTTRRGLEVIERNANLLTRVIADLLEISAIITGKVQLDLHPIDVAPLLASSIDTLRPAARAKEITLENEVQPVGDILGDPARLQQILWNLLSNAIKFTAPGGRVRVALARHGMTAQIIVSDSGVGIDPAFLPYVFERFRQERNSPSAHLSGLGVGLAIVRQLVELHGGTVSAASEGKDRGATFIVSFPVVQSGRRAAGDSATGPENALAGLQVLIVEDYDDSQDLLAAVLEAHGASVIRASTCREGLAGVARRPDVIVADIGLPDEDGYSFIRQVRARENTIAERTPAIALTAFARPDDRDRALAAGYQVHMAKPFESKRLLAEVLKLVQGRMKERAG